MSTIAEERAHNPRLQVKLGRRIRSDDERPQSAEPEDDGRRGAGQHAPGPGAGGRSRRAAGRSPRSKPRRWLGQPEVTLIDLRETARARTARQHSRRVARALPRPAGEHPPRRHAPRTRRRPPDADAVLLRVRRALGDGGAGGAGRRHPDGAPHPRRDRGLEKIRRPAGLIRHARPRVVRRCLPKRSRSDPRTFLRSRFDGWLMCTPADALPTPRGCRRTAGENGHRQARFEGFRC